MNLKRKITVVAGALLLGSLTVLSTTTMMNDSKTITNLVDERATNNAKYFSSTIDGWLIENAKTIDNVANLGSIMASTSEPEFVFNYLNGVVNSSDVITDCYLGFEDGHLVDGSGWNPPEGWSCLSRGWYTGAIDADGDIFYGDPYVDDSTGALCLSISKMFTFKDGVKCVVSMDMNVSTLFDQIDPLVAKNLSDEAYVVVASDAGEIVYHPNDEFVSTSAETKTIDKINDGKYVDNENKGTYFKDYDGENKFVVSHTIDDNQWTVYLVEPKSVITNEVNSTLARMAGVAIGSLLITYLILSMLLKKLLNPLTTGVDALSTISSLDLKKNDEVDEYIDRTDEIGDIAKAIKNLQTQLASVVGEIKTASDDLNVAVKKVDDLSESSASSSEQISQAVGELATSSQSMASNVQDANSRIVNMGDAIDRIVESVEAMKLASSKTKDANDDAIVQMSKLKEASDKSSAAVEDITRKIAECNTAADSIKAATEMITDIAGQTNLLSLNASIEAARAGEAGRGFAVVASEIKGLSEQSSQSASEIQDIVKDMISKVNACVTQSTTLTKIITEQMSLLNETESKIGVMSDSGNQLADEADSVGSETENLVNLKEAVLNNITDLSAISEENAASAQQVSASVETIAGAISGTKNESANMKALAESLKSQIDLFK